MLASMYRAQALINTRRARDGKDGDSVNEVLVNAAELARLAGCGSRARALRTFSAVIARGEFTLDPLDADFGPCPDRVAVYYRLRMPNFAEFQGLASGPRASDSKETTPQDDRRTPPPISGSGSGTDTDRRDMSESEASREDDDRGSFTEAERSEIAEAVAQDRPWAAAELEKLELDFFAYVDKTGRKVSTDRPRHFSRWLASIEKHRRKDNPSQLEVSRSAEVRRQTNSRASELGMEPLLERIAARGKRSDEGEDWRPIEPLL